MKATAKFLAMFVLLATMSASLVKAQGSVKVTADVVSSYVWRGSLASTTPTPHFQPTLAYVNGNFEIGAWGSTSFNETYKEVDPYVSYTAGSFKVTITDYNWNLDSARYFNYKNKETWHRMEGSVAYTGPESFPISLSVNTIFYGRDKKATDPDKQNFSTYIEAGYAFSSASIFMGVTPSEGMYGTGFGVVNLGVSSSKSIKITDSYSLPIKASLITNPQTENIHLVFGITF